MRLVLVDCRSEFVSAQAAAGVRVLPLDRASVGGVGVDVTTEFASQVRDRGENAAGDDLAFDLGEPDLDLVEPRGIRGGEVNCTRGCRCLGALVCSLRLTVLKEAPLPASR